MLVIANAFPDAVDDVFKTSVYDHEHPPRARLWANPAHFGGLGFSFYRRRIDAETGKVDLESPFSVN